MSNTCRCDISGPRQSLVMKPVGFYSGLRCGRNEVLIAVFLWSRGPKREKPWMGEVGLTGGGY